MTIFRMHTIVGLATFVVFAVSGMYLRFHRPPLPEVEAGRHMMFLSRHIYLLAASLVHLVLGIYGHPFPGTRARVLQGVGSALLTVATALLVTAFVVEPMAGRGRTAASSFGLYFLLAGVVAHFFAAPRRGAAR